MKLQQLRYFLEVCRCHLNISEAAEKLFTSQPGISKQIKLLEEELGVSLFVRHGKRLVALTPPGEAVVEIAERIFRDVRSIRNIGTEFAGHDEGRLTIATTPTLARYVLPSVVAEFLHDHPKVSLSLVPASPAVADRLAADGEVDFAINAEADPERSGLRRISGQPWQRCLLVPRQHSLAQQAEPIAVETLLRLPLVAYAAAENDAALQHLCDTASLPLPQIVLSSSDPDIIKTYVRAGVGVGLLADTAYHAQDDADLCCLPLPHLFAPTFTCIAVRPDAYLRGYAYDFMQRYLPHLSRSHIQQVLQGTVGEDFSI